ncbi:hypothetical protein Y032_0093g2623 [Ancylostoma ceylanicum]|uniref:Uncharacterized protein n=1 Tax=Ancylostoma ceylanicum TaxID=53326 RepID=A0A016TKI6_9BILA|nr:hypothetical protein Y032_0093g2623 [Ancylostoma ceylanicum]
MVRIPWLSGFRVFFSSIFYVYFRINCGEKSSVGSNVMFFLCNFCSLFKCHFSAHIVCYTCKRVSVIINKPTKTKARISSSTIVCLIPLSPQLIHQSCCICFEFFDKRSRLPRTSYLFSSTPHNIK